MTIWKCILGVVIFFTLGASAASSRGFVHDPDWGVPVSGLQVSLSEYQPDVAGRVPSFQLQFRNVGDRDFMLNLGRMLGNGQQQPDRVVLELRDSSGQTKTLRFFHKTFVAGRVDDYLIPLRVNTSYSIVLSLDQFYSAARYGPASTLPGGESKMIASFNGAGAANLNSDTVGLSTLPFWTGKVSSNSLVLQR